MIDQKQVQVLRDFVEGRLPAGTFEALLSSDPSLEALLQDDPTLPRNTYVGSSTYLYLLEQDYVDLGGRLNAQGAVSDWLKRHDVAHVVNKSDGDLYSLVLAAQPRWLDVEMRYVQEAFLSRSEGRQGDELKGWLRAELLQAFKYVKAPPDWIQNPEWPISREGPLVFLGQVPVERLFHDMAAAYVFYDASTRECTTVLQVA